MNIVDRAQQFVHRLQSLARPSRWHGKTCPHCGSTVTVRNGTYARHPQTLRGRVTLRIQRHLCRDCGRSYAEQPPHLVPHSWYGRGVHRLGIDFWCHGRMSLRRAAEFLRSLISHQERWRLWQPWCEPSAEPGCRLHASTLHRWLDRAGQQAEATGSNQWAGVASSGLLGTDGTWARLRGGTTRVVLVLVDRVSGLCWPPVVAEGEQARAPWDRLLDRARQAGLDLWALRGIVSDGAWGLKTCLYWRLRRVRHQRCVFHLWRSLRAPLRDAVAPYCPRGADKASRAMREHLWRQIHHWQRAFFDEPYAAAARGADAQRVADHVLGEMAESALGQRVAEVLQRYRENVLVSCRPELVGLGRVGPEWLWRDWRQRLSRGHNHGSEARLRRAAWVWTIYRNFTPRQARQESKRAYAHAGQAPLEVAGMELEGISYLDALGV